MIVQTKARRTGRPRLAGAVPCSHPGSRSRRCHRRVGPRHDRPLPGTPTVVRVPCSPMFNVAPRPPNESEPRDFERLTQKPGQSRTRWRKRKPITVTMPSSGRPVRRGVYARPGGPRVRYPGSRGQRACWVRANVLVILRGMRTSGVGHRYPTGLNLSLFPDTGLCVELDAALRTLT